MAEKLKITPARFVRQVREETRRVRWPSRKETVTATLMVLGMVALMSLFFFVVDQIIGTLIQFLLG